MKRTVLVISSSERPDVDSVQTRLEYMGESVFRLNTDDFPASSWLNLSLEHNKLVGSVSTNSAHISFEQIKSVFYRGVRPAETKPTGIAEGYMALIREESRTALWSLATCLEANWVNPPVTSHKLLENNKLYQMKTAASIGLAIPRTIITNDPEVAIAFAENCGGTVALKQLCGRMLVFDGEVRGVYTQRISCTDLAKRRANIAVAPVLLQEYIVKRIELRVTIVGEKIFACAIHSQDSDKTKHDWRRYDLNNVRHEPYDLPLEVANKLLRAMDEWGLLFGAIDMIVTPDEEYVFLEVNPSGQWGWIEELTGLPITAEIAHLLAKPFSS